MKQDSSVAVIGLGEVGSPLLELFSEYSEPIGIDVDDPGELGRIDFIHVCIPFEIPDFVGETARYIEAFRPQLTMVHSTVGIGTTRQIAERTGTPVVHSPIRGKHARMLEELKTYTKFVGAITPADGHLAARHLQSFGLRTQLMSSPEATELTKLTETTYFGLMIAWAQELERYCDKLGLSYSEVVSFYDEISFFPAKKYFPGPIGGHCVMPNIEILKTFTSSSLLDAIEDSNLQKTLRDDKTLINPRETSYADTAAPG